MTLPWQQFGQALFMFILGVMLAFNTWQGQRTVATLSEVHVLVNNQMEMTQKALAEVSMAKYLITRDPLDKTAADAAMNAYLKHIERKSIDGGKQK